MAIVRDGLGLGLGLWIWLLRRNSCLRLRRLRLTDLLRPLHLPFVVVLVASVRDIGRNELGIELWLWVRVQFRVRVR